MKKIKLFFILISIICLLSCENKYDLIGLKTGDIRRTETDKYIMVERCDGFFWEYVEIIRKDTIVVYEECIKDSI